jgi:membrane peptidoglycan carboxypeptidase
MPRTSPSTVLSHLGVMVAVAAVMGILVAGLAIPFAAIAGLGARDVAKGMDALPSELTAEPLAQRTVVLASDGSVLATWYDQNRQNVQLNKVSMIMRKAIIAIEDYRFYEHGALDLKGTLRAFVTNQASDDVVQGGSSITQQMVKQTLVNQAKTKEEIAAATADTYARKFRELRYAIAFEEEYSKDWILERYLNISYFGDGAYGIETAARHYFSKPAKELNLKEAALLAGIVKNPSRYDPTDKENRKEARQRRNTVLARMAELNVISVSEARKASRGGFGLKVQPQRNGCLGVNGEFFCDYVREYLKRDPALGDTLKERERLLDTGGLTIETTIDPRMQKAADASLAAHTDPTDQAIGGLAMVEPGTGAVKALAQSRPMGADKARGRTFLNYVVPREYGDANGFQAGSTFKVFVLAAALKQGIPLTQSINSPQQVSIEPSELETCDGTLASTDVWEPANSTGAGRYNLITGTRQSVNTFFAQLEAETGLCDPVTIARQMGIEVPETPENNDVVGPFTLGVTSTNPLDMAAAYATFAARGEHCTPRPVSRILSTSGKVLAEYPDDCRRLMPTAVADAVNEVLEGVQEPGGFGYDAGLGLEQDSAGKTGTINENMSVWFVGYTPNLATASMLAGANSLGHWVSLNGQTVGGSYIDRAFGSTQAGPIWGDAMQAIDDFLPDVDFVEPDTSVLSAGQPVTVPEVGGLTPEEAAERIRSVGLVPEVGSFARSTYDQGTVADTLPTGGAMLGTGTPVEILISNGRPPRETDE